MDFRMREALRKSRIYLVQNVEFENGLLDHLIDQDIFADSMLEYIRAGSERTEKIRRMLDYLVRRPESCFERFLQALTNSGQEHCARKILKNFTKSGPTQASDDTGGQSYPSQWSPEPQDVEMKNAGEMLGFPETETESSVSGYSVAESSASGYPQHNSVESGFSRFSHPVQESCAGSVSEMAISSFVSKGQRVPSEHGDDVTPETPENLQSERTIVGNSVYADQFMSNPDSVYCMESSPRGLALVINNEKFDHLTQRPGSKMDMQRLHQMFKILGFAVCHEVDRTAQGMKDLLRAFSKMEDLDKVHSLVVVILSHGGRGGVIYGKDGHAGQDGYAASHSYITDDQVRDYFSSRHCPSMAGKPKLIIIQACRGKTEDFPVSHPESSSYDTTDSPLHTEGGSMPSSVSSSSSHRTADMADICLIHSAASGYVSYRHPEAGSPFINTLTEVFMQFAGTYHLLDIMTEVTRKLSAQSLTSADLRTVPCTTHMLTKKWFLNPPYIPA